jgi:hypothetical protein
MIQLFAFQYSTSCLTDRTSSVVHDNEAAHGRVVQLEVPQQRRMGACRLGSDSAMTRFLIVKERGRRGKT